MWVVIWVLGGCISRHPDGTGFKPEIFVSRPSSDDFAALPPTAWL